MVDFCIPGLHMYPCSYVDISLTIACAIRRNLIGKILMDRLYSGTCVLWTPWDQPKVSRLSRCPDFPGQFI